MRIVLQRVSRASVSVGRDRVGTIEHGYLLLVGVASTDVAVDLKKIAGKIVDLRVFEDDEGKMNRSLRDVGGAILAVSQFTLHAHTEKGRRPSFTGAASPEVAEPRFDALVEALRAQGVQVETGRFGAKMSVELVNDGPVTLVIEVETGAAAN